MKYRVAAVVGHASRAAAQRRLIVEAATNGMLVVDPAGSIELANPAAERIFGYASGALRGVHIDALDSAEMRAAFAPSAGAAVYDPLQPRARTGDPTGRRSDGSIVFIDVSVRALGPSNASRKLVLVTDVEERRARESSAAHTRRAGAVVADIPTLVGHWRLDIRTMALVLSDEARAVIGAPMSAPRTFELILNACHADDRDRVRALVDRAMTSGTAFVDDVRIVRGDGLEREAVVCGNVHRDAGGHVVALSGTIEDVTERRSAERSREALGERFALANRAGNVGIWELDLRTNVSIWNADMFALYGITDTTQVPTYALWSAAIHPHDRERATGEVKDDFAVGLASDTEFRVVWENGEIHNIRSLATIDCDAAGVPMRIIGTDWDVTEVRTLAAQLHAEQEALVSSEARYRALTEAMPQMVWVIDADAQFEYVNERWSQYTGLSLEASRAAGPAAAIDAGDAATIETRRSWAPPREFECEVRVRRADGAYRWHLMRTVPFQDATGDAGKWIVTATDIEDRKAAERILATTVAELEHLAHHDAMTNLPNRKLLMDELARATAVAKRAGAGVVVMYLDLDRFKWINDTFGHAAGDRVLAETGARIAGCLRTGDTASRVGGDEFVVVCATGAGDDPMQIGERLINAVRQPIDVGDDIVAVEASVGISMFPGDGADADDLIRKADAAMYAAKQSGRNACRRYSEHAHIAIASAGEWETELRHAIASGELVTYFQPIVNAHSSRPVGAEALVRWQHPQRGLLPPGEFIAFAEERNLIGQIGDIVLHAACQQLAALDVPPDDEFTIAVNVSAHQFGHAGFVTSIVDALARHGADPRRIAIEITESVVMGKTRNAIATLHDLRALGLKLSIDDFGTGYSSLAYLKNFPIDTLKIDRSFVHDIGDDATDQAIAKTIITLAHSLRMRVVAEGVETLAQADKLRAFGTDAFQGYLFGRPMAPAAFTQYMQSFLRRISVA